MEIGEINKLLTGFYDGKTTEEQEEMLREYFQRDDVPEQFLLDKKLFMAFRDMPETEVPSGLEDKLTQMIDRKYEEEKRFMVKNKTYPTWRWLTGIAASVMLLIGLGYGILNFQRYSGPQDTFTDPDEAYEVLQATLIEISSSLNNGMAQLNEAREDITEINNKILDEI